MSPPQINPQAVATSIPVDWQRLVWKRAKDEHTLSSAGVQERRPIMLRVRYPDQQTRQTVQLLKRLAAEVKAIGERDIKVPSRVHIHGHVYGCA